MVYIYTIKLENGKYYIGKTTNPRFRLDKHFNLSGSQWTKLHKPVKVIEIKDNCDDYDEDKITKQYMNKYGIDNVRGGSYVQIELSRVQKDALKLELNGSNDACFKCGKIGHFANECYVSSKKRSTSSSNVKHYPRKNSKKLMSPHWNNNKKKYFKSRGYDFTGIDFTDVDFTNFNFSDNDSFSSSSDYFSDF